MKTTRNIAVAVVGVLVFSIAACGGESTPPRRIPKGALVPEFSAVGTTGNRFAYTRSSGKVLILAFLSPQQKASQQAVEDILGALSSIPSDRLASLQVAFVLQDVDDSEFISSIRKDSPAVVRILKDDGYHLWGKFGVIATPTVLISDSQGKVLCVKAGHAYDFWQVVKSGLYQALRIPYDVDPDDTSSVRTVANSTMSAKARRHLQMAELLSRKGRIVSAIEQARMAYEIDPNLPEVALELGELLCRAGQAQQAIKLVSALSVQNPRDKARISLALGWANRQMGKLEEAEKFLQEGIRQDSTSPRLYFELGRIYQQRNNSKRAMQAYSRALQLIYHEEEQ